MGWDQGGLRWGWVQASGWLGAGFGAGLRFKAGVLAFKACVLGLGWRLKLLLLLLLLLSLLLLLLLLLFAVAGVRRLVVVWLVACGLRGAVSGHLQYWSFLYCFSSLAVLFPSVRARALELRSCFAAPCAELR